MVGHFLYQGLWLEGRVTQKSKNGWFTVVTFFRHNTYKIRTGQLFSGHAPLPY